MGYSTSAYVAYGVRIPVNPYRYDDSGMNPAEQVDQALSVPTVQESCPDVGHLQVGAYDKDMFFLTTECHSADLGRYIRITYNDQGCADWNRQLQQVVEIMGWSRFELEEPCWFVVADES